VNLYFHFVVAMPAGWLNRHQQLVVEYLQAENQARKEQLGGRRLRRTDVQRRRLATKAKAVGRAGLAQLGTVVTADTLLRWYRTRVAEKYDGSKARKPGRPCVNASIGTLIAAMARSNPTWGYTRTCGALLNLGHEVARNTVKRILTDNGLDPAPQRSRGTSWKTFLASHMGAIAGADFFTVETLSAFWLIRHYVFFVIDIGTRRVHIAGITSQPCRAWMQQIARNVTDAASGFLSGTRYLILERDPLYTHVFRRLLAEAGINVLRLPPRSLNLNAFAERFVRSIRSEGLDRVIPLSEKHLRHLVSEYVAHYHLERNRQGLGNRLLQPLATNTNSCKVPVRTRSRRSGLVNYYYQEAV